MGYLELSVLWLHNFIKWFALTDNRSRISHASVVNATNACLNFRCPYTFHRIVWLFELHLRVVLSSIIFYSDELPVYSSESWYHLGRLLTIMQIAFPANHAAARYPKAWTSGQISGDTSSYLWATGPVVIHSVDLSREGTHLALDVDLQLHPYTGTSDLMGALCEVGESSILVPLNQCLDWIYRATYTIMVMFLYIIILVFGGSTQSQLMNYICMFSDHWHYFCNVWFGVFQSFIHIIYKSNVISPFVFKWSLKNTMT